ncbi:MAG: DUF2334 domain-containing protein [Ignavibacteriae bacterium]|nr:DUF2334 domain-containing protein [Ignavibacteria bacterium]MBI3364530.1 DUF2334 domain-containing protein [Ignavibacteriota bacterium]
MTSLLSPIVLSHRTLLIFAVILGLVTAGSVISQAKSEKNVLILFEGSDQQANLARGDARELAMLLGHFKVSATIKGVDSYSAGEINQYDLTFFVGFSKHYDPPDRFLNDVYDHTEKSVVWMNTGLERFSHQFNLNEKFGFTFLAFDTAMHFDVVRANGETFTKGEPNLNLISISDVRRVELLATAYSTVTRREYPYIVRCGHFLYVADSPFASATETDRYILFADMLHDILGEDHEESHRALLRIEDVDLFENPTRLRDIADLMSSKHVPFLVGIIPFYVDPDAGIRLRLSDKPEFVDAIHYMVAHGATIVLHGITHQYQGVTASDYEFWDGSMDRKIRNDSKEYVEKKMKTGLEECWKNNIYPLVWETPHYTASQIDYPVFAEFFSTAMEQRLVIDNSDYSQYFPYIIEHDLFGQRIIPENLGYIPLSPDPDVEEKAVQDLLRGAKAQLTVRDGFSSCFIHPFIDLKYMEEYVDGAIALGYTFVDVKNERNIVQLPGRVVMTGEDSVQIALDGQYLRETWLRSDGKVDRWEISKERLSGIVRKFIEVPPGEIYIAEPSEYYQAELSFVDEVKLEAKKLWEMYFQPDQTFEEARVALAWDTHAKGTATNDQASFAAAFRSLNIPVDSLVGDTIGDLSEYNLLVVPYNAVEHLSNKDYDRIVEFLENGGNVITDGKNDLAEEFGVKFASSTIKVERMRDHLYPEDPLVLNVPENVNRFDSGPDDEIFCSDERTEAAVAIGRKYGEGRFIFLGMRFDPVSNGGYSRFPYLLEYVRKYFMLQPILKRENLEVYFDDGYRHNVSIEDLVKRWGMAGVRVVHVVGWHQYPTWTYDYKRLIDLCHANGMLVYAWLDPPQVSEKFWTGHPEWQELNYKSEAVRPSWRYPVALTSAECLRAVKSVYTEFLQKYDWDGVNLAELYFDAGNGPKDPKLLTPMHSSARDLFCKRYGFDPAQILDPISQYYWKTNPLAWKQYEDFRVGILTDLHEEFLQLLTGIKAARPHLDIILTAMDNLGSPELRPNHGVDIERIIDLMKRYNFTLQVEDPQSEWSKDPRRYSTMGQRYQTLLGSGKKFMLDLNILQFRDEKKATPFPTLVQTGIESYLLAHAAALGAPRFSIYSESSTRPQDLRMMGYAASARAIMKRVPGGWHITTPFPVVLELPKEFAALTTDDGQRITSDRGAFLIPQGDHVLHAESYASTDPFSSRPTGGKLLSITGELGDLSTSNRSASFSYNSATRCIASFTHRPFTLFVDGKETNPQVMEGFHRFSVVLPPGEHTVIAILETTVSYGVDITSFWSSWLIVGFGMMSGAALLTFYTVVRVTRRKDTEV